MPPLIDATLAAALVIPPGPTVLLNRCLDFSGLFWVVPQRNAAGATARAAAVAARSIPPVGELPPGAPSCLQPTTEPNRITAMAA